MEMEKDTRRMIAGTGRGDGGDRRPTTSIANITDDVLELVLLRVRTATGLFRAAATCKQWRRVVAGDGFLHRFRSRHGHGSHLLLGHYSITRTSSMDGPDTINTKFVPSPPRPAIHLRQRVSLDFLAPSVDRPYSRQELTDSRGGLLAFVRDNRYAVVSDPWTRQYRELGRSPWQRRQNIIHGLPRKIKYFHECIGAFLLDGGSGGNGMSSFSLLCAYLVRDDWINTVTAEACVFSAGDNRWHRRSFSTDLWNEMYHEKSMDVYRRLVGRAGGSIFWSAGYGDVLVLDESTLEFSTFMLPDDDPDVSTTYYDSYNLRVVGGGVGGAVHIVRIVDCVLEALTARRVHGAAAGGDWECGVVWSVHLCELADIDELEAAGLSARARLVDTATTPALEFGPLLLSSTDTSLFSIDVDTMSMTLQPVEKTTTLNAQRVLPYELPWPQTI